MAVDLLADDNEAVDLLENQPMNLKDVFGRLIRERGKQILGQTISEPFQKLSPTVAEVANKAGYGAVPFAEQLPTGVKEGILKAKAGLTGGQFTPSPVPTEYGAGAGRSVGQIIGQGSAVLPATLAGSAIGGPVGGITALGLSTGATTPGSLEDRILEGTLAAAVPVGGKLIGKTGGALAKLMRGLTNKSTEEALIGSVQGPHDILKQKADTLYEKVRELIGKRNVKVPVDKAHLAKAEDILPKTRASRQLIDKAKSGDYDAVHDLQSHLYKRGTADLSSGDTAKINQGEEILELRNDINENLHKILNKEVAPGYGEHKDISNFLKEGSETYRQLMDTYFHKNLPRGIGQLVHPDTRKVPDNLINLFKSNSRPMQKFLRQHPETARHVTNLKEKQAATEALKKIFLGTTAAGALGGAGKVLYDLF